jgi:hypothetical protein
MVKKIEAPEPSPPVKPGDAVQPGANTLEGLALSAERVEVTGAALPGDEVLEEPARPTNAQLIADGLLIVRDMFCAFTGFQSPKEHLQEKEAEALGVAWGAVADKYGLDLLALGGEYSAEIGAVMVTVPVAIAINSAVRAEMAEHDKRRAAGAVPAAPPAPAVAAAGPPGTYTPGVIPPARFPQ